MPSTVDCPVLNHWMRTGLIGGGSHVRFTVLPYVTSIEGGGGFRTAQAERYSIMGDVKIPFL